MKYSICLNFKHINIAYLKSSMNYLTIYIIKWTAKNLFATINNCIFLIHEFLFFNQ